MPRAKLPLNKSAVQGANEEIYSAHESDPRPNALFDVEGNRKSLDPQDPTQADLREEWMALYVDKGGKIEDPNTEPVAKPVKPCEQNQHYIEIVAQYDDPWQTLCTNVPTKATIAGGVVFDGPKTKGLKTVFGDGLLTSDPKSKRNILGTHRQEGVPAGDAVVELAGDPNVDIKKYEDRIQATLKDMESRFRQTVKPWADEWNKEQDWFSKAKLLIDARNKGQKRGATAWKDDQVEMFKMLGDLFGAAWDGATDAANHFEKWFNELSMIEKAIWPLMLAKEGGDIIEAEIKELWKKRDQILALFKAFAAGSIDAIEKAIDVLVGMSGEIGKLAKELKEKGWDWVQATIEVCRESKILTIIFGSLSAMIMMIPPTLWVEGYSTAEGYIIPEVIVTLILILITYLSAGAGGTLIAARIAGYVAKIRSFIKKLGALGKVFNVLFDLVAKLKDDIVKLVKALYKRIVEKVKGTTNRTNKIRRSSRGGSHAGARGGAQAVKEVLHWLVKQVRKEADVMIKSNTKSQLNRWDALSRAHADDLGIPTSQKYVNLRGKWKKFDGIKPIDDHFFEINNPKAFMERVEDIYEKSGMKLHPILRDKLKKHIGNGSKRFPGSAGVPGLHAEVRAVNELLHKVPKGYDLKKIKVATVKLGGKPPKQGADFVACHNCGKLLSDIVTILTGH